MKKNTYVAFTEFGARIYKGEEQPKVKGQILINPQLPEGVPPHLWKLVNGKIEVEKDPKQIRQLSQKGENMNWSSMKQKYVKPKWKHYLEVALISLVVSGLVKWLM